MRNLGEMQMKFLMLGKKLGLEEDILKDISEGFKEKESEYGEEMEKGEKIEPMGKGVKVVSIDIAKPVETKEPTPEDIEKMNEEEVKALAKRLVSKEEIKEEGKPNPLAMMLKKRMDY